MNKNTTVTMAAAVAGILTLLVMAVAIPHQAFATSDNCCNKNPCCDDKKKCCDDPKQKDDGIKVAVGGSGGSGGAGGAGGEGGNGGTNVSKELKKADVDQNANGGNANGGYGGNANGGNAQA
jgi:hypothetical protein